LRDYGISGQLGLEATPEEYVRELIGVFREVRRVLQDDGTLWLNLGDSYATSSPNGFQGKNGGRNDRQFTAENLPAKTSPGLKPKDLIGIPWRVALALQADGWYLRQDIIWSKPNPMPESVTDRCTKAHEYIFLLSKSPRYYFDQDSILEPMQSEHSRSALTKRAGSDRQFTRSGQNEWKHEGGRPKIRSRQCEKQKQCQL
jgi:site-specific DNA-methyltransferase (adenine-specific)